MSDTYIPGVKSKYETDKLIADLMKVERIPKERAEKNVETLNEQKSIWQDVGRRMTTLRESARSLYSFQNPFNERVAHSADEAVLTGTATREATEQERTFLVKRAASADRFLSKPVAENFKVEAGEYAFRVGKDDISFSFRGGTLKEFTDALNRRGKDKIRASTITVEPNTRSLVIESLVTGEANRLGFMKDAEKLGLETGLVERVDDKERKIVTTAPEVRGLGGASPNASLVSVVDGALKVAAGGGARLPVSPGTLVSGALTLEFELSVAVRPSDAQTADGPPPGPALPPSGSATYGGVTVQNDPSTLPLPPWTPPPAPVRVDDPQVLGLVFSDGTSVALPPIHDSTDFDQYRFRLSDYGQGKQLVALDLTNRNTHRDITIRSARVFDPDANGGLKPRNPVSTAGDATVVMDGIEVTRSSNNITDLIPGVTLTVKSSSDAPVKLAVEPDRDAAKEAVIALVGNYNRLVAEVNVLTRNDDKIIRELSYLKDDEVKAMEKKLGALQGDSTLNQFKTTLQRAAASPYPTSAEQNLALLSQLGVSTDARRSGSGGGYDASRLRGYLEIDEKALDTAIRDRLPAIRELFGNDTDGDLIIDSGFAYAVDSLTKPFVETGGILALKTGTIDSRVDQEKRRIETLDKQLVAKEDDLKRRYGLMEGSLSRMEQTSSSIDQFGKNQGQ